MPTFDTPGPITVSLDVVIGDIRLNASDRQDTVVQVRPSNPGHDPDVRAAEQTTVDFTAAGLVVKAPKQRMVTLRRAGSIDLTIDLPTGSTIIADTSIGALRGTGRLGETKVKSATGDIEFEQLGRADLSTSAGTIFVDSVTGSTDVTTGSGRIRLRQIDGSAAIKNSNGDTWVGEVSGELRVKAANGAITVDQAGGDVTASTANGDIRLGEVVRGMVSVKTSFGQIEVGVHNGTAAMLDAHTSFGTVRNYLDAAEAPEPSDEVAEVHARTSMGDIVIRRAG